MPIPWIIAPQHCGPFFIIVIDSELQYEIQKASCIVLIYLLLKDYIFLPCDTASDLVQFVENHGYNSFRETISCSQIPSQDITPKDLSHSRQKRYIFVIANLIERKFNFQQRNSKTAAQRYKIPR